MEDGLMQGSAPVKYIVGILTPDRELREHAIHILSDKLGGTDHISDWHPFSSHIYTTEMGEGLERSFISLNDLFPPEALPRIKQIAMKVEDRFRVEGRRRINLDPGYVDHFKIVLASHKFAAHRIAVDKGCYADLQMYYEKGRWNPLPWCYPDLASGTYEKDMIEIRKIFKAGRSSREFNVI